VSGADARTDTPSTTGPVDGAGDEASDRYRSRQRGIIGVVVALTLIALPWMIESFWLGMITQSFVWMIATLSVVVLYRATAAVSLCQASFMGVAANAGTWFVLERGWPVEVALFTGAIVAVPVGMVLVFPALRLRGIELTILTLMVGVAIEALLFAGGAPFKASDLGLFLQDRNLLGIDFGQRTPAYFGSLGLTTLVFGATLLLLRGRVGQTWQAIQTGNAVAASAGISLLRYKVLGFAIAALIAGTAGSLLLAVQGSADGSSFNVVVSIRLVVLAMVGGVAEPVSAVIGGIVNGLGLQIPGEFGLVGDWLDLVLGIAVIVAILGRRLAAERHPAELEEGQAAHSRRAAPLAIGSVVLLASMALPWFDGTGGAIAGWQMPALFVVGPLVAVTLGLFVASRLRHQRPPPTGILRILLALTIVMMGLVAVRVAIGSGVFFGVSGIESEPGVRVERAWGLLLAAHGALLVIATAVSLLLESRSETKAPQDDFSPSTDDVGNLPTPQPR